MLFLGVFLTSFIIGFSGAIMPGPMLGVTIEGSLKKGWITGPLVVVGHAILELVLILLLVFGAKEFFSKPLIAGLIGLIGGAFLAWMGIGMIRSGVYKTVSLEKSQEAKDKGRTRNPILAGALVSVTNPYWILWWSSTGIESIRQSYDLGLLGVLLFYFGHILSDFVWFSSVSAAIAKGKSLISDLIYQRLIMTLGFFIFAFSLYFVINGWLMLQAG
ncbi:MAG TPA: LysE family transporter [Natronincola sp.]|nr:LysE family transporter [Natronincola sp.]